MNRSNRTFFKSVFLIFILFASAKIALAEDVIVQSLFPVQYGEYEDLKTQYLGTHLNGGIANWPSLGSATRRVPFTLYGDMNLLEADTNLGAMLGTLRFRGNNIAGNNLFTVAPGKGFRDPANVRQDGFRINADGNIFISTANNSYNPAVIWPAKINANPSVKANGVYAAASPPPIVADYGYMEATNTGAFLGSRAPVGGWENSLTNTVYSSLLLRGNPVFLGANNVPGVTGNTAAVLIGTTVPMVGALGSGVTTCVGTPAAPAPLFVAGTNYILHVNGSTTAVCYVYWSSRELKKDIMPLTGPEYGAMLSKLDDINVVRYRYKSADKNTKPILGIIAEEAPEEILDDSGKTMSLTKSVGFLSAAMKELIRKNELLKARLELLEREAHAIQK